MNPTRPAGSDIRAAMTDAVAQARSALAHDAVVVLVDNLTGRGGAALVAAAHSVTTAQMANLIRYGSGFVEIAIDYATARRLSIPTMVGVDPVEDDDTYRPLAAVGVDAATRATTGISACDRAHTARVVASPRSTPSDLTRPGHLLPVLVSQNLAARPCSLAAGALTLVRGITDVPAAVHCELVSERHETQMASVDEAEAFAMTHDLAVVGLAELCGTATSST